MDQVITLTGLTRFFPLLNASLLCGLLALVVKYRLENRKLSITENTGLRSEFIEEMKELREEVKGLRSENGQLRDEVRQLHGIIDGMRRQAQGDALSAQRVVLDSLPAGSVPPVIADAARRADRARRR
jgi:uncharacterized protein YlxW (UPF0749 family)